MINLRQKYTFSDPLKENLHKCFDIMKLRGHYVQAFYWIITVSESEFYPLTNVSFIVENKALGLSRADTPLRHDENGMTLLLVNLKFQGIYGGLVSRIKDLELRS